MHNLINAFPLYKFLNYCNKSSLDKSILDCGAGGSNPPLTLFKEFGYITQGIEISDEQLKESDEFCNTHNIDLNIIKGDMTDIPFENESFSFLFSYNTSVHIKKVDFYKALTEFNRVLKKDGLCFVNVLTEECDTYGIGQNLGEGQYRLTEDGDDVMFCHYKDDELEEHLKGFDIVYKEKRIIKRTLNKRISTSAFIDYVLIKK